MRRAPIYDLTVPMTPETPAWPGDPEVEVALIARIDDGDGYNLSRLSCSNHTGTHVDAPWHFFNSGSRLDDVPLDRWIGPSVVADLGHVEHLIESADLDAAEIPIPTERLLLRTRNSSIWQKRTAHFVTDYVALSPAAAHWIVDRGIRLVGVDYASVDPFDDESHTAHKILLGRDVLIIENLDLSAVASGSYHLICLPLKLHGVDGAPARVILTPPA